MDCVCWNRGHCMSQNISSHTMWKPEDPNRASEGGHCYRGEQRGPSLQVRAEGMSAETPLSERTGLSKAGFVLKSQGCLRGHRQSAGLGRREGCVKAALAQECSGVRGRGGWKGQASCFCSVREKQAAKRAEVRSFPRRRSAFVFRARAIAVSPGWPCGPDSVRKARRFESLGQTRLWKGWVMSMRSFFWTMFLYYLTLWKTRETELLKIGIWLTYNIILA